MYLLLPYASGICNPKTVILNLSLDHSYDMYNVLKKGNVYDWEREVFAVLLALISTIENPSFLDIGANIGIYPLTIGALFADEIPLTAVEPNPMVALKLQELAKDNGISVKLFQNAVNSHTGEDIDFFISKHDSASSLINMGHNLSKKITVQSITLDSIYHNQNIIKIDTEGTEDIVLMSGIKALSYSPILLVEILNKSQFDKLSFLQNQFGYHSYHLKKNFDIVEINGYEKMSCAGEYNFMFAKSHMTDRFMQAHQAWVQAITLTNNFNGKSQHDCDNKEVSSILLYLLKSHHEKQNRFEFFPISNKWLAFYFTGTNKLIHYEYGIVENMILFSLHFETPDMAANKKIRDIIFDTLADSQVFIDMNVSRTDPPAIIGITFKKKLHFSSKDAYFYALLMDFFIGATSEQLIAAQVQG